ncbi:hypothetical protein RFI_26817 [Reticulomyxa filosa]|uniref:Uncharacterized protein n=1 Tax=Reticulomyxa filosa TaxID=46433 RepID=X6MAR6_RETFI|nr:hypothetical protein RFI_26817 [Reticulomyxa filosa]|eukprot:ETO10562.1 hypothetical protein RFI_26817 [Reticulomyxa filosa]
MTEGVDVDKFLEENDLLDLKESFVEKQYRKGVETGRKKRGNFKKLQRVCMFVTIYKKKNDQTTKKTELDDVRTAAFIAAIRKIKGSKSTSTSAIGEPNVSSSAPRAKKSGVVSGNADLVHLIISPQEHEAITKLHERFDQTSSLVKQLEQSFDTLKKNGESCQQDITSRMELVYKQVQEWQAKLYEAVDAMKNQKIERLQQQLDQLKTYRAEVNQGKNKYQELIDDPSLDVQSRKKQVVEMVDKILGRSEIPLLMVTQPKVEFGWSEQYLNTLLSHIVINDCDQPFPPYVIISVEMQFKFNVELLSIALTNRVIARCNVVNGFVTHFLQVSVVAGESGREVLEFAVEYAVLPSDEANANSKSKSSRAIDDGSSFRNPSVGSEALPRSGPSRLLVASSSQANVSGKSKGKSKKKKDDDSSSEESKSDKSSEEDNDEDNSSESSSEEESDESGSDKDSDKSSDKSSGDSDASDSSTGKKKKARKKRVKKRATDLLDESTLHKSMCSMKSLVQEVKATVQA